MAEILGLLWLEVAGAGNGTHWHCWSCSKLVQSSFSSLQIQCWWNFIRYGGTQTQLRTWVPSETVVICTWTFCNCNSEINTSPDVQNCIIWWCSISSSRTSSATHWRTTWQAQYMVDLSSKVKQTSAEFWRNREGSSVIPPVALDFIPALALQAFVKWLFPFCGMLTTGRRNQLRKSLHMRPWPKMNFNEIRDLQ